MPFLSALMLSTMTVCAALFGSKSTRTETLGACAVAAMPNQVRIVSATKHRFIDFPFMVQTFFRFWRLPSKSSLTSWISRKLKMFSGSTSSLILSGSLTSYSMTFLITCGDGRGAGNDDGFVFQSLGAKESFDVGDRERKIVDGRSRYDSPHALGPRGRRRRQ